MFSSRSLNCEHKDLIHDVAYNWYGNRLATCSSDQQVKIWDYDTSSGSWICSASWKTHSGSVWKVTWAHPEFGQVIATCSFDRTAAIWEELPSEGHWVRKSNLVDSRTSMTDIKFAPRHLGLLLATCSADGTVRIYEAPDVMNLSQWPLQHEIACKMSCSCLSWNPSLSRSSPPMIAVGSDDTTDCTSPKVIIFEYNESLRRWLKVETFSSINEPVHDIAFAPNIGRSYNVLAVATKDLQIITLKSSSKSASPMKYDVSSIHSFIPVHVILYFSVKVRLAGHFNEHASTVWRVCWNVTGSILASSGDDGLVRLWKCNYQDNWSCIATLKGDGHGFETVNKGRFPPSNPKVD